MTRLDPLAFAEAVSAETALEFVGSEGRNPDGLRWLELVLAGHEARKTFTIRAEIGWRRLDVRFRLGNFAGDLMAAIRSVDESGRHLFRAILEACAVDGAEVVLSLNGNKRSYLDDTLWNESWRSFSIDIGKGMLAINEGDANADQHLVQKWATRLATAVIALLPVEEAPADPAEVGGLPEGATVRIEVNRYERDPRNRMAALAIHGYACLVCGTNMEDRYGPVARRLIEVHHVVPVSELGEGYVICPREDLAPLCPDCHAVAHRRSPPYSIVELQNMLRQQADSKANTLV